MNAQQDKEFIQELKAIISQELQKIRLDELQPDDYTVQTFAREEGLSVGQARRLLNDLADQGYFERVKIPNPNGGGARIAYRPVEKKKG